MPCQLAMLSDILSALGCVGLGAKSEAKSPGTQGHPAVRTTRWAGVGLGGRHGCQGRRRAKVSAARHTAGRPSPCWVDKAAPRGHVSSA